MKSLKSFAALLFAGTLFLTSCKKDKDEAAPAPQATIEGTWVGKYGAGNDAPDTYFSFVIKGDGTMKVSDDPNNPEKGSGTWKEEGGSFTGTYVYKVGNLNMQYTVSAKYKADEKKIEGSWNGGFNNSGGDFYLNKK